MVGRFDRVRGLRWMRWMRWMRNAAVALALLLVVVGLLGFLVAPGLVQSMAERQIAERLGRKATIGQLRINPYRLSMTIDDFKLYEADGTSVAVEVGTLYADLSSASLFKRALVFDELRVTAPTIRVARLAPERFSFSDVVDKLASQPKGEPLLFSLNNIQVDGGTIAIDDRVGGRKHVVDGIRLALPFISNLPYDTTIFVTPEFAARVDGSAIGLTGKAQPFSATRETAVALDVTGLDLPEYMDLVPTPLPFRLASGKLEAKLALTFRATGKDADGKMVPQSASLSGQVGIVSLDLRDTAGHSVLTTKAIDVDIAKLDPFNGDVVLRRVELTAPQVDATRRADGGIDLVDLLRPPAAARTPTSVRPVATASTASTASPASNTPPATFAVASFKVVGGSLRFTDQSLETPLTTVLKDVTLEAGGLSSKGAAPATFKGSLRSDDATLEVDGRLLLERREVDGSVALRKFRPAVVAPYLASTLAARIDDGSVDLSAHFHVAAADATTLGTVDRIALRIDKLRTRLPDDSPLIDAERIALDGGRFDLATRAFTADALRLVAPTIVAKRDAKGRLNLMAAFVAARPAAPADATAPVPAPVPIAVVVEPAHAPAFSVAVEALSIERGDVRFEDLSTPTPVRIRAQPIDLKAQHVGTATNAVVPFELTSGIDRRGKLAIRGKVTAAPLDVDANIDATQVPVGWLAAYAGDRLNVVVDSADLDAHGALRTTAAKNAAQAGPTVSYRGSLGIGRMRALDRTTSEAFVQWKTLDVPKVELLMPGAGGSRAPPLSLTLGDVALTDFYARVIVNASGRLNLQDVVSATGRRQSVTTPESPGAAARPAAPTSVTTAAPTAASTAASTAVPTAASTASSAPLAPPSGGTPAAIRVGTITLASGRVGITDNFIQPNYSANLTDLAGTVSAVASVDTRPATVKLRGRINGDGALDVSGSVDPFAATRYTDLAAEAKDIELTRLTPYAIKYAGYAIDRGKLSMTVKYHIENGKLDASNRLFLDQLTFGAKVDSPTATRLPVLLAVALLKNSRGEIDVNLPISGSLSDPEFSVGAVIGRVLVNLLTRAVTSPFSLLASAAGAVGGRSADELGYVQFKPGVSDMTPQGKAKLETLAKALAERPALKLDIIGRFDPATDPDGIKRDHLLDRLKHLKASDRSKSGDRVGRDDVTIEPAEYASLLARVYDDTKLPDKPRNLLGIAKTVPVDEMERRLLDATKLDGNDPRWLAEARADVVRHDIEDTGRVSPSRVFLVTPRLDAGGIDDRDVASRVDFALR